MEKTCLRIDVDMPRNTKEHILPPGTYQLECIIGSNSTRAYKKTFEVYLSGEWHDDEVKMYEKGFNIKVIN